MDKIYNNIEFHSRIYDVFLKHLGYKRQSEIAKKYSYLTPTSVNKFFHNQKTITRKLIDLLYAERVNIDWICTGRGEPTIDSEVHENTIYKPQISIFSRIDDAFNAKGVGQSKLVEKYDFLSTASVSNYFNVNTTITKDLAKLCFYEDINIDWVCTGRGDMFINELDILNKNEQFVDKLIEKNKELEKDKIEDLTLELLKKLTKEQKEYYYHKISADLIENNMKNKS